MILNLFLLIFLIIYIFLLHNFLKKQKYFFKVTVALSISILFVLLYQNIKDNEGYAVSQKLPKSFYVLNSYIYDEYVLLLVKKKGTKPRLYKLKKTLELNKFLNKYNALKRDGQDVVVKIDRKKSNDSHGMYIETIRKELPPK